MRKMKNSICSLLMLYLLGSVLLNLTKAEVLVDIFDTMNFINKDGSIEKS